MRSMVFGRWFAATVLIAVVLGCGGDKGAAVTLRYSPTPGTVSAYASVTNSWSQTDRTPAMTFDATTAVQVIVKAVSGGKATLKVTMLDSKVKINGQSMGGFALSTMKKGSTLSKKSMETLAGIVAAGVDKSNESETVVVDARGSGDKSGYAMVVSFPKEAVSTGDSWDWTNSAEGEFKYRLTYLREESHDGVPCYLLKCAMQKPKMPESVKNVEKEDGKVWVEKATGELVEMIWDTTSQTFIGKDPARQTYMSGGTYMHIVRVSKK